jgi:hypothetical protein
LIHHAGDEDVGKTVVETQGFYLFSFSFLGAAFEKPLGDCT